jgi:hypothetical protein
MGAGSCDLEVIIRLRRDGHIPDRPAIIEIGAQQLATSFLGSGARLTVVGKLFGVALPFPLATGSESDETGGAMEPLDATAPLAREFWEWLGCEYASIDIEGSPGSIPLDLNFDAAPPDALGRYHLVTNLGTTEHVANQLNAFKLIHDLTALGGVMIHNLPAQGMPNHGLVNYNSKFFWTLARSNGYNWLYIDYTGSPTSYELPENVVEHIKSFRPDIVTRVKDHRISDAGIIVALQKVYDIPFVPPLDVNPGVTTSHKALEDRYWTVFKPDAFASLPRWHPGDACRPPINQPLWWRLPWVRRWLAR